jgi:DNA helicase II / ATP-dependent DNA helicase PcrA
MIYLSEEQKTIVKKWTSKGGAMIVEAPAGSGKTRVLTECVRTILEQTPKEKFRILCITFTNKAAEEMQERLEKVKGIRERVFIGTIHAFSLSVLKAYRHELGYEEMPHIVERENDRKEILKSVIIQSPILARYYSQKTEGAEQTLTNLLKWISDRKRELLFLDDNIVECGDWEPEDIHLYKEFNNQLRNQNLIDFEDILLLVWRILSEKLHVASIYQRLYKRVLIDEAQDLNFAQYQLIKMLCGDTIKDILMMGDGKQAIHGYAGANKKYMFEHFLKDFSAQKEEMRFNYRSSKKIVELANKIVPRETESAEQHFEGIAEVREFEDETAEANWIVSKIKALLEVSGNEFDGQVTLEKIAILARNKFVFKELQNILDRDSQLATQYSLKKGSETLVPESDFMKLFDLGTRLLTNCHGDVYLNQVSNLLKISHREGLYDSQTGLGLLRSFKPHIKNLFITSETYDCLLSRWETLEKNISQFCDVLEKLKEYAGNFSDENERALAQKDIEEWQGAWNSYVRNVPANSKSLADFRRYAAMGFNKTNQSNKGLTLATVHTAKGLEFDIVFLMGMNQGTFPDYRSLVGKELEEEKNNAYVAVTRAKRHIYVSYPKYKMMSRGSSKSQKPSIFIENIPLAI